MVSTETTVERAREAHAVTLVQAVAAGRSHSTLSLFAHETKPNQSRRLSQDAHTHSIARVLLGLWVEAIPGQLPNLHTKPFLCEGSRPPANRAECPAGSLSLQASPLPDCPGAGGHPGNVSRETSHRTGCLLLPRPRLPRTGRWRHWRAQRKTRAAGTSGQMLSWCGTLDSPRHSSPDAGVARGGQRTSSMTLPLLSPLRRLAARARRLSVWHRAQAAPTPPGSTHYIPG